MNIVDSGSIFGLVNQTQNVSGHANQNGSTGAIVKASTKIYGKVAVGVSGSKKEILSDTTSGWNNKVGLISSKDTIYVYTDYAESDGKKIPNIKIGDGNAYLIDLPFIAVSGITEEQIASWDNKVSVSIDPNDPENLIFYID